MNTSLQDQTLSFRQDKLNSFYFPPETHPPVFLHCGWRTRGTWIWNQYRQLPHIRGYYEPLNETLAALLPETVARYHARAWPSGHRGITAPYFAEFGPFLSAAGTGVRGFSPGFSQPVTASSRCTSHPQPSMIL